MILQALNDYYQRKANDPESGIAPPGWEKKELPFLVVITRTAEFVQIMDTREDVGKKKRAKSFLVPTAVKRANAILANLLWDNIEYVLGIPSGKNRNDFNKIDRVQMQQQAFLEKMQTVSCETASIILAFLNNANEIEKLKQNALSDELFATNPFISFQFANSSEPVFREEDFIKSYEANAEAGFDRQYCLVTGQLDQPARLHSSIKGVRGAQTTGANIVSFNFDAVRSYGKVQGLNAPVGEKAMFAYTTALNSLLEKDSTQKLQVGDATTVFWAAKSTTLEKTFADFWEEPPKDNPDRLSNAVISLFQSVQSGSLAQQEDDNLFYVLGLSPNASRLSIRFWHTGTIKEMAVNICRYFDDLSICHGPRDQDHLSLWRLLVSTASQGKTENINPLLAGEWLRTIFNGLPFPKSLLQAALLRCKAEREVTYPRAKLIKACLNRQLDQERKLNMSLDKEHLNVGYRLGRLFATLEKIQNEANPGVSSGIRAKFYASASSSPVTVFGNLMRLKNHHLDKLSKGRCIEMENLIGEILYEIKDFPTHLPLDEQGRFAIGYYHQMQDFYTKKEKDSKVTDATKES